MLFEKQQYQQDCVSNIIDVLKETENLTDFTCLQTSKQQLHESQDIPIKEISDIPRLDVLMETGTGKTFTYIQTMYQLNKEYRINKFIIFVPRLAIREGVIQNIKLTSDYFYQLYGKRLKFSTYQGDKSGMSAISDYIRNKDELSVLVLTSSSIAIAENKRTQRVLTRRHETIGQTDKSPLDSIAKLNPIIFIDEPHLLKGGEFTNIYNEHFNKSLCIRFGATFPEQEQHKLSNVVYVLDSLSAFREYLVKKIRVTTIVNNEDTGIRFLTTDKNRVKISYFKENIEYSKWVGQNTDLGALTGNSNYNTISITKITATKIHLSNYTAQEIAKDNYTLDNEAIRAMIKRTIEIHFAKEQALFKEGIKTLSLFFIPNISDFRGENPRIKNIFEEEYKEQRQVILQEDLNPEYKAYLEQDYDDTGNLRVHDGYFSGDRGSNDEKEAQGVNLILKDKESLLSTRTPLRFIFSVWALQEGWDNPNIFNICKLASSNKETSRRQQVGRGLRLAVNQNGKRQTIKHCGDNDIQFYNINMLDVIVSGQETNFIENIQNEINSNSYTFAGDVLTNDILKMHHFDERTINRLLPYLEDKNIIKFSEDEDCYHIQSPIADFLKNNLDSFPEAIKDKYDMIVQFFVKAQKPPVENANKSRAKVSIRSNKFKDFENLWHEITRKAKITYHGIDETPLIEAITKQFNKETINPIKVISKTQIYNHVTNEIENKNIETLGNVDFFKHKNAYGNMIKEFADAQKLPLSFTLNLFKQLDKDKIKNNPKYAVNLLEKITKDIIHSNIIQNVGYQFESDIKIGNKSRSIFYDDMGKPLAEIEANKLGRYISETSPPNHYLYDKIIYDSTIEETVVKVDPENIDNQKITVFAKLPFISIPTPYKNYNPDFAYYIESNKGKKLFLIVETKGYNSEADIPADEKMKINYAIKFFERLNEINHIQTVFKKRINKQELHQLLQEVGSGQS